MTNANWKFSDPLKELDEALDNAYKRVESFVGFKLGRDRINLDALSGSAQDILDINLGRQGPAFMRISQSIGQAAGYRPKDALSLKELAAEILEEFYQSSVGGYQAARLRQHQEAEAWLVAQGRDEESRRTILAAAEEAFLPPPKEEMTREALPYVKEFLSPSSLAIAGGFGGFGLVILTLRHPLLAAVGAAAGAALAYYFGRKQMRNKARALLAGLPKDLYNTLRRNLVSNQARYEDIVNGGRP